MKKLNKKKYIGRVITFERQKGFGFIINHNNKQLILLPPEKQPYNLHSCSNKDKQSFKIYQDTEV